MTTKYFRRPAPNGPLGELPCGNTVAQVWEECVTQVWRDGQVLTETSELRRAGKFALAMGTVTA
jgi:hypothetical protein